MRPSAPGRRGECARGGPRPTQKARGPAARASGRAEPGAARGGAELRGAGRSCEGRGFLGRTTSEGRAGASGTRLWGLGFLGRTSRGGRGLGQRATREGRSREGEVESWAGRGARPARGAQSPFPARGAPGYPPRALTARASVRVGQRIPPLLAVLPTCSDAGAAGIRGRRGHRPVSPLFVNSQVWDLESQLWGYINTWRTSPSRRRASSGAPKPQPVKNHSTK